MAFSSSSRGVKGVFENPLYDPSHPDGVPPASPGSPSQLPPSDPDFSPTPYCPPKLLFPEARSRDHARRLRRRKETTTGDADPFNGESSKVTKPSSNGSTGKGKQVRPPRQKSEWDTSDEEDAPPPEHERHRPGFTREREKTRVKSPAVVTRALEVPQEKVEVVPTETIGDRPKRTLRRSTRQIPAKR